MVLPVVMRWSLKVDAWERARGSLISSFVLFLLPPPRRVCGLPSPVCWESPPSFPQSLFCTPPSLDDRTHHIRKERTTQCRSLLLPLTSTVAARTVASPTAILSSPLTQFSVMAMTAVMTMATAEASVVLHRHVSTSAYLFETRLFSSSSSTKLLPKGRVASQRRLVRGLPHCRSSADVRFMRSAKLRSTYKCTMHGLVYDTGKHLLEKHYHANLHA